MKYKLEPVDAGAPQDGAEIGILDRNVAMLARASRVVRAASGLRSVATDGDPAGLRAKLSAGTRLLLCDGADLELVHDWTLTRFPRAHVVAWSPGPMGPLLDAAHRNPRIRGVLGWPSFLSMPRPWELALAVRRALYPVDEPLHITELFAGAPVAKKYRARTSSDRDAIVAELAGLAERAGATGRLINRIGEVGHELLMNAMYDAPVNHYGEPRYAHDRRADLTLDTDEVPVIRLATDGTLLAIQVSDPFGRLTRAHVLAGLRRGLAAAHTADTRHIIDASHGGAGLGLWKIYSSSTSMLVDVLPGRSTSVTAVFELDVNPREARTMPPSLHLLDHAPPEPSLTA